jgi:hypothetical protein
MKKRKKERKGSIHTRQYKAINCGQYIPLATTNLTHLGHLLSETSPKRAMSVLPEYSQICFVCKASLAVPKQVALIIGLV